MITKSNTNKRFHLLLLISGLVLLILSGLNPLDRVTWALEVFPAVFGLLILVPTYRRFPLSNLVYVLIWIHALILIVGGHYTYAEMPLFNWIRDAFDLQRNYYDRVGHVAQGFVPAMIAREILLRTSPLKPGKWIFAICLAFSMAISSIYELIEWAAALILAQGADQFLATQGDQWDTQNDMFCCLIGATLALILLSRLHNKSLKKVMQAKPDLNQAVVAGEK